MSLETIDNLTDETVDHLKELVQINVDSAEGFKKVAEQTEDSELQLLFQDGERQRAGFAEQLRKVVEMNDEDVKMTDSLAAQLHRWWISVRETISASDRHALLAEAERGEEAILEKYRKVVPQTAGSPLNDQLNSQFEDILGMKKRIEQLRKLSE